MSAKFAGPPNDESLASADEEQKLSKDKVGIERSEPSLNVSREELNQSYQDQLERRISD